MPETSTTEELVSVTPAPDLGQDVFYNKGPLISHPGGYIAFGGSVISQAIAAASATAPEDFDTYSLQSSFLRPINASQKVRYQVDRIADGRTTVTRIVHATQADGGPRLYTAIVSFQRQGSVTSEKDALKYGGAMPTLDDLDPHSVPVQSLQDFGFLPAEASASSPLSAEYREPFEWRPLPFKPPQNPLQARALGFVRSTPLSTDSHNTHIASLAFLSDQSLLEIVLFPKWEEIGELRALVMSTTLTHQVSFHRPNTRADEWLVCEGRTSWGANGRILAHQRFWSLETGELVMSCTQDALIDTKAARL